MAKIERTFLALKPGGIERGLLGEIIGRFERRGFRFIALKLTMVSRELTEKHYAEHKGKGFFEDLVSYATSGPVVLAVIEGWCAISVAREMVGATDPKRAKREITLHFPDLILE